MENLKQPYDGNSHYYLKPEVFCAEIICNGLSYDEMVIKYDGAFKKSFRSESGDVCYIYNDRSRRDLVQVSLNRDGIYDRLPEGLFHQTYGNSKTNNVTDMVGEYRRFREEERQARKFFQPIEHEIFRYSMLVEQEEQLLSLSMLDGTLKKELHQFWGIGDDLPQQPAKVLLSIMPWVVHIKGDMLLTAKALGLMLNKRVIAVQSIHDRCVSTRCGMLLGESELGFDTVTGSEFEEPSVWWTFTIHDLTKKELSQYPETRPFGKFLKQFGEIFIPLTIDIIFDYEPVETSDETGEETLGYSLVL